MPHPINRRQKPAWRPAQKPLPPRPRPQAPRKKIQPAGEKGPPAKRG
ncbi:MAG TPA: hypothetical protein VMS75_10815 [Terriglobales bacterium]|nr:hypothetical protein [Terriglobales bacterium]